MRSNKTKNTSNSYVVFSKVLRWSWLVVFYGISTLIGYLMPKAVYTYTLSIYDLNS